MGGYGNNQNAEARRRSWFARHKAFTAILVLLAAGLLAGGYIVYRSIFDPLAALRGSYTPAPTQTEEPEMTGGPPSGSAEQPPPTEEAPPEYVFQSDTVNFLILGTDADAARVKKRMNARTDCIMIASINVKNKTAALVSIPRDTYVKIYNEKNKPVPNTKKLALRRNRINAAFTFGGGLKGNGIAYAQNTVNQFLAQGRIPIDHYVLFDMDLVANLIDAVGGVDVPVRNLRSDTVTVSSSRGTYTFRNGATMHMDGGMALTYARDRHNTQGSDEGRVSHQQDVVIALLKALQDKGNIVKAIPQLFTSFRDDIATDIDDITQIIALAWIAKDMDIGGIKQYTIRGYGLKVAGASILVADQDEKARIVREVFGIKNAADREWTLAKLKDEINEVFAAGKEIVDKAQALLDNYAGYYTEEEARALVDAIAVWQGFAEKRDTEGMDEAAQDVKTQYDHLSELVEQRKEAIDAGREKADWATGNLQELREWISAEDQARIQGWIDAVRQCVEAKDYAGVGAAANALAGQAGPIFDAARAMAPTAEPTATAA